MEKKPLISIYTCVYNMCDKIQRALQSVKSQTYRNIEHVIVDDGSSDGLEAVIEKYKNNVDYSVVYYRKQNGGKHTAENVAFQICNGDYLVQLDADDELLPDALMVFMRQWDLVNSRSDGCEYWCVSCAVCNQFSSNLFGKALPNNINDLPDDLRKDTLRINHGEKCGCMKSSVIKQFRFPEPKYVTFVTESVVWNQIEERWKTWYCNDVVRVYYISEGESLSKPKRSAQYFSNYNWMYRYLNEQGQNFGVKNSLKYAYSYCMATSLYKKEYDLVDNLNLRVIEKMIIILTVAVLSFTRFVKGLILN